MRVLLGNVVELTSGLEGLEGKASVRTRAVAFTEWANSCSTSLWLLAASRILPTHTHSPSFIFSKRKLFIKDPHLISWLPSSHPLPRTPSLPPLPPPPPLLPADEAVSHHAQLLHLSPLLLRQVLHGLLRVEAGSGRAVHLPLVLPRLQRALKRLSGVRGQRSGVRGQRGLGAKENRAIEYICMCMR